MSKTIDKFEGEYSFLSNFYPVEIKTANFTFPSTENAYQALKTLDKKIQKEFVKLTPGQAKRKGRKIGIREDWEDIKLYVMEKLIDVKFENEELKQKLLATGDAKLIEGNNWGDTFWGMVNGKGENYLGKILMNKRKELNVHRSI